MRRYVLRLAVIGRPRIHCRDEIIDLGNDAVRRARVNMAVMVVDAVGGGIKPGERIDPRSRTEIWARIEARAVGIGTSRTQMGPANTVAAQVADIVCQGGKGVLHLRLADLLKAFVIGRAAAHAVDVLRNNGMVIVRQLEPVEIDNSK